MATTPAQHNGEPTLVLEVLRTLTAALLRHQQQKWHTMNTYFKRITHKKSKVLVQYVDALQRHGEINEIREQFINPNTVYIPYHLFR